MIAKLPTWYHVAQIFPLSESQYERRSKAINSLIEEQDESFMLECVRLYLGKPLQNRSFLNEFSKYFNDEDPMFVLDGVNNIELRVLAGATVATYITTNMNGHVIAWAIQSGQFGLEKNQIINFDIVQKASEYLEDKAIVARSPTVPEFSISRLPTLKEEGQTVESLIAQMKSMASHVKKAMQWIQNESQTLHLSIKILQEESNIHWWIFRMYSFIREKAVQELNAKEAPFILAKELSDLFIINPATANKDSFLNKILSDVPDQPAGITVEEFVALFNTTLNDLLVGVNNLSHFGNLTPLNYAFSQASEQEFASEWIQGFERKSGINANKSFKPIEIGSQFLTECLLTKL